MESDQYRKEAADSRTAVRLGTLQQTAEELMNGQCHAMKSSPHNEVPRSTMPESAQQHGQNQIDIGTEFPFSVPSQRNIKVVAQPG